MVEQSWVTVRLIRISVKQCGEVGGTVSGTNTSMGTSVPICDSWCQKCSTQTVWTSRCACIHLCMRCERMAELSPAPAGGGQRKKNRRMEARNSLTADDSWIWRTSNTREHV